MSNAQSVAFGKIPFDNVIDALEEAQRIRASSQGRDMLVKVEESPYGGYQVSIMPADLSVGAVGAFSSNVFRKRLFA